ncbi:MAG: sigma-54-dependent Fis family transcriptional regulator [Candidatus Hydrogenedentes bacterium]|nr:sigma-54-dependent Fis family transcriptional regulator [Candidatus Hydrogenedentota bacterium]
MQIHLERQGHKVMTTQTARGGLDLLETVNPEVTFVDLNLPDISGLEIIRKLKDEEVETLAVMITGEQDANATIEAIRLGAFDYIRKPLDLDAILVTLEKAAQDLIRSKVQPSVVAESRDARTELIGADPMIIDVLKQVAVLSDSRVPVLIQGESGTGKELVAQALHETAGANARFVAVNCSAVVPTLLESELFGHEKGAFTGADATKAGKLEHAGEGTVFLDEIGDMTLELQAKLLRALQEREFERVGGNRLIPFKARVIAATHRDLQAMVAKEQFRQDLYYRLAVSTISVPPLRERRGDIPLIVKHLLARNALELHRNVTGIEEPALRVLQAYDWPGNVRELSNVVTRAILLARSETLTENQVLASMGRFSERSADPTDIRPLRDVEKDYVEKALNATGWNISRTAELLDISRVTLRKKIADYEIQSPSDKRRLV